MPSQLSFGDKLRSWLPKKIDFYILTEIAGPFLGGILFFSFIFLMFQALRLAESFIVHGAPGIILLKITGLMLLSFLPTSVPIAFLIGILVGFGRLSTDSELVAMKANGMSIHRLARPALALSLLVAVFSLALNLEWVPTGDRTLKKTLISLTNTKAVAAVREGTFTSGFFDLLIYADKVDARTNRLQRVFIYDEREPKKPLTVIAQEGEVVPVKNTGDLGSSAALRLYHGSIHSNEIGTNTYQKIDFNEYQLFLKVEAGAADAVVKPRMIPYHDIRRLLREPETRPQWHAELTAEIARRWSLALAPLIFVFIGIGYGTVRTRAVRSGAALITFGVMTLHYVLQVVVSKGINAGAIPPLLGMAIPLAVLGLVGYRAYRSSTW